MDETPTPIPEAIQWTAREYEQFQRGKRWYSVVGIIVCALIAWSIWAQNYLFAIFLLLAGIVLYWRDVHSPAEITVTIDHDGITLNPGKTYPYADLRDFWIHYKPPEKVLYCGYVRPLRTDLIVPLEDQNPLVVRAFLSQYIKENLEREHEPVAQHVGRILKI